MGPMHASYGLGVLGVINPNDRLALSPSFLSLLVLMKCEKRWKW